MSAGSANTRVVIRTVNYQISGEIGLLPGCRLTDYMTDAKAFIAVIDAKVVTHAGQPVFDASLLNVNSRLIEVIAPAEALTGA